MSAKLNARLEVLGRLSTSELKTEWVRVFRADPPRLTPDLLRLAIGYRLQERLHGGLPARTRRQIAAPITRQGATALMKPGTRLLRSWNGRTIEVLVTDAGYQHDGRSYGSLSQIAREITGTAWSGPRFFGLRG